MIKKALILTLLLSRPIFGVPYEQYVKDKKNTNHPHVFEAEVLEVLTGGGYTFLKIMGSQGENWAAIREIPLKKGDKVSYTEPMVMENFYSKSIDKKFDKILFISKIRKQKPQNSRM